VRKLFFKKLSSKKSCLAQVKFLEFLEPFFKKVLSGFPRAKTLEKGRKMLIVSGDEIFSAAIKEYLEDLHIEPQILDRCVIVDLDFSSEMPSEKTVTFSRDENKYPDLVRPFIMTDLAEAVVERFAESVEIPKREARTAEFTLSSDGVTYRDVFVPLTAKERDVLGLLLARRGMTLSREEIFSALWGVESSESNVIDVYVRYLRKKLDFRFGERIIYTRRGCGYYIK